METARRGNLKMETYHVTSQPGTRHGGEVGRARVVLAAADDADPSQLSCTLLLVSIIITGIPVSAQNQLDR